MGNSLQTAQFNALTSAFPDHQEQLRYAAANSGTSGVIIPAPGVGRVLNLGGWLFTELQGIANTLTCLDFNGVTFDPVSTIIMGAFTVHPYSPPVPIRLRENASFYILPNDDFSYLIPYWENDA